MTKMKTQNLCLVFLMIFAMVASLPLDLGNGGVYNSPEANAYWERRFGRGFFSNLASLQRGIDSAAKLNKAALGKASSFEEDVTIDLRQSVQDNIDNDLSQQQLMVQEPVEVLTIHPGPLYFDDVHF